MRSTNAAAGKRERDTFAFVGVTVFLGWSVLGLARPATWQQRSGDVPAWLTTELMCFNTALSAAFLRGDRSGRGAHTPLFVRDLSVLLVGAHVREARRPAASGRSAKHHRFHHVVVAAAMAAFAIWAQRLSASTATRTRAR